MAFFLIAPAQERRKSMISNSGKDENRGIKGGVAGDQGGEWNIINWYNRPWNCILRHPDSKVRAKLAELHRAAALNNKIGYDQNQRNTYWNQLKKANYNPAKITVACEADCSAGVIANTKAVGHLLGIDKLKNIAATYTGNMRSEYKKAGFEVLTASKYLTSAEYLLPGDILLNDSYHTAINLDKGSKASGSQAATKVSVTASLPILKKGMTGSAVGVWQEILCAAGFGTDVDNSFGPDCEEKTIAFEKSVGITNSPHQVGPKAWAAGLNKVSASKTF